MPHANTTPTVAPIADELIQTVCARLADNRQVRHTLPGGGRVHIDRKVPFLCVYRYPPQRQDAGTDRLVVGEASYLIVPGDRALHQGVAALVRGIVATLAEAFGGFLIVELWAAPDRHAGDNGPSEEALWQPGFRILSYLRDNDDLSPALARMERGLAKVRLYQQQAQVTVAADGRATPPGLAPLLTAREARSLRCRFIGLEVQPVYRDGETGDLYPMVLRTLHRSMARVLKQALFEFVRARTSHHPTHYHALGRQAMVKAVWQVDRQLAQVSDAFDFLLHVTPINAATAWSAFKRDRFGREPVFYYRPLPVDPVLLKRSLYNIHIERVEDPTLWQLFQEKQRELDQQISMLLDRGTRRFLYGSLQLFGAIDAALLQVAEDLLRRLPPHSRDESQRRYLDAQGFAARVTAELDYYRQFYPQLSAQVFVRDDINTGLMVSHGDVLVGKQTRVPVSRVDALLHHEVGTHVLTYFNGRAQPFQQLHAGLAGYEELQEGIAVLAEYLGGYLSRPRLRVLAGRVVAAHCLVQRATFLETFRTLTEQHMFDKHTAFTITMRIYRGGGLTKDAVYLRGLLKVLEYLQGGGELEPLFVGKIAVSHIPLIRELRLRKVLSDAPLQPRYMQMDRAQKRLAAVRQGMSVYDLVERRAPAIAEPYVTENEPFFYNE
jgi:uncharacterized protein (TIGR02421 family)